MRKAEQKTYNTTSFYLSCFLLAKGVQLIGLHEADDSDRRTFVFVDSPMRMVLMDEYNFDEQCEVSYADRKGKYQAQKGIVLPKL